MTELDDHELLADFAHSESEVAFAALVARHVNLVYAAALRFTGNPHHAEEITQAVFIVLARKAGSLRPGTVLSGWLYQTARLTAANFVKGEIRRQRREQEAYMQSTLNEPDAAAWEQIAPLLDEAMGRLGETDRNAIVLRFFENKSAQEVAAKLKLNEAAAHKRVNRAVEKLRKFFIKRGVTLTATGIAGAVSANSVQAAPIGLAASVAATAAKGTLISATITTLVQGTMKTMTWLKLKFAIGVGVAVVLAGGVATLATLATANKTSEEQSAPPTGSHAGATFFSVLERTPIVANAVFEKELFMDGVPAQARKQTFTFLADGDNYRLSTSGIEMGKFEGISWQQQNGYLVLFDPKINQRDGNSGGVVEGESVCKMTVDLFLALGIKEMLSGSAVWDQNKQRFTAKTKDGKDLVVETTLKNGVPAIAYILTEDGQKYQKIQFRYSPGFYSGQVPTEFTAYWIKPGAKTEQPNDQKIYNIRVKALEISDEHLDQALLDPIQLAATSATMFYSNNIEYSIGKAGKVSRVLTAEEYAAEIKKLQGNK